MTIFHTIAAGGGNLLRSFRITAKLVFLLVCLSSGQAWAQVPDLTAGGVPTSTQTLNLGPTGMRGWLYHDKIDTSASRQILVTAVDQWSPAEPVMAVNDVILGADGTGADPVAFSSDAYWALAGAIAAAETNSPATLKLLRWRSGSTTNVAITLETLGAYSATAPYNCPKSAAILEKGLAYVQAHSSLGGRNQWGALALLAGNDAANPNNSARQALAASQVQNLILDADKLAEMNKDETYSDGGKNAWWISHQLVVTAEYYLKTGDTNVLPSIAAYAHAFAMGQSMFGTTGHIFAYGEWPDGSQPGNIMAGYGPINMTGTTGLYGMLLAKQCGVVDAQVDAGIERASRFFRFYTNKGSIPYGEHGPWHTHENQGKMSILALCYEMQAGYEAESKWFSRCAAAYLGNEGWFDGHTGPFFQQFWPMLGAAVGGQEAAAARFNEMKGHYDMMRRWDGSFVFNSLTYGFIGADYNDFPARVIPLLTYALPLQQLRMTGAGQDLTPLTTPEVTETIAAGQYDATAQTTNSLLSDLGSWSFVVRNAAAVEIGERTAAHAALLPTLTTMANDTGGGNSRYGAIKALGIIADASSAPVLAALLTDADNHVRMLATEALSSHPNKASQMETMLAAVTSTARPLLPLDEEDPMQYAHGDLTHMIGGLVGYDSSVSIDQIDRTLLNPAIRAMSATARGGARSWAVQNIFPKLTLEQAYELADCIVDTAYYRAPADAMFSAAARVEATRVLQRYDIAEGVPLAILLEDQDIASSLTILKGYAGAAPIVQPDAGVYDYLDSLSTAYITQKGDVLAAIAADVFPIPATPYKSITVVTPDAPALTLPANRTTLHVNGADPVGDALYTWRKVYGRGNVVITPSGTSSGKDALVQFDGTPGLYCFEVTMHDRRNLSEVLGTVIVTLNDTGGTLPSNAPPVATSQSITVNQSTPQLVTLIATDPEGYDLSYTVTASPAHGSLVGTAPYLIYHPDLPYVGGDSMSFEVMDSEGQTDSATITISVETLSPLGLAVYEPFDYPAGLLNGASGTNAIGLTNAWAARTDVEMVSGSPSIANALTAGGKVKTPTWGKRSISSTALVDNGLLDDGATLWMSCMVGYMPGISSGQLRMALANNHLHDYNGSQRIVDDGAQAGHGVGWFFYQGNVSAACYRNDNTLYLSGSSSVSRFAVSEVRLLVAKFSWAANTNDPDRIELYYVGDDMLLPAQSLSSLNAVVDQSQYDVLTFREYYNDGTLLDEIRLGDSFQSVIAGTVPMTPDVSAPTPDPALFTVPPTMLNATSVTMTAATAYDPSEVEYAFVCTVGGGNSSGWQSSPIYIDTGLTPGVEYRYTVQARDGMAVPHTTAISAEAAVTLPANTTVPDMVGLLQVQGENLLASAQLILGTVSNVYDATAVVDEIISQTPVAGSTVTVTSAVNVTVSLGRDPTLAPLLVSIVDDVSGGPVQVADPILYTITFSEDMDAATVGLDDFGNAGTASSVTLSDLSELSPGVFRLKAVPMTPGTLQLQINSAAVLTDAAATALDTTTAIPDDTTLTINPVGLVVYEPFDYPVGSLANKKGLSEIGLAGIWSSASWVRSGAPVYGLLATEGNWLSDTTGWINGDARMLSSSAVAERRLLEDGATLWFSMLIGNYQGTGAKITVALANSRFHWYYIVDPADAFGVKIADGEGVGIWFGGENGSGAAGCLQAAHFSGGPSGETVGTTRVSFGDWSGTPLGDAEVGLLVGKFTWNANPANPDTIDVYQVGTDLLLPATPVSTLNVTVDQSILNTLTFHHDGAYALDEIRFGGSYASVVPVDFTPPTLGNDDFVDDQVGGPILENTLVTYTVTFSEDIDAATVSAADFENRASTAITFGAITETTAPGVFTVEVTPTEPGELRLQVAAGASIADLAGNLLDTTWAIFDYTLITVNLDNLPPTWSSNPVSTADGEELVAFNGDLSLLASDPDLDSLTFTKLAGPSWLNVASNGTLSGTPGTGTSGVNTFTVSVKDPFYPAVEVTLNIYVVLPGATPPTLAAVDIVDDQTGGPVQMNDLLVYTVTFSEDIDAATVVAGDFANAGDSSITVGAITETSPGVFTVEVTPSTAGTLRLQVRAGASILDVDEAAPLDTSVAIVDVDIITVEPPPMVIYEPFDYAPAAISSITQGSGTSDFGLDGDYLGSGYCQVKYLSFGHGSLLVQGNGFRLDGRNLALARDVSQTALTDSGLLRNGATLWFSMVYGTQADASLLPSIGFTLANGSFASGIANYYIENWDGEEPSGLGFYYGYLDGVNGRVAAAQYRSINYGSGSSGKVLGTREAGTVALGVGESRLVVGKITWAADSADPDTIELYQPGTDMLLPASPISTLSVVVDQATYDTISVMCDYRGLLDELRFGSSYDGVVPLDTTPPTLAAGNIVDNRGGADIMQNEIVQYTVTFSEQMDASSLGATDFTNAGTASITVGAIAQIRPGVFTIEVTPTSGGTLQLRVPAGATIDDLAGNPLNTTAAVDDDTSITSLADVGNPTLVSIVDNRSGANIVPNAPVIYTITFSEDMDPATIGTNDFSNAGTASITIGTLAQVSLSVYQLQVTPTGPDPSTLQLQISAGAILTDAAANPLSTSLALADDTTIVVSADPEPEWNTDPIVEIDADEDAAYGSTLADDASDFYTNTLTFSKVAGPAWLSVGSDGLLSGTPLNADVGLNSFTVDVTDDIYIVPVTLQITVINVNDAPEFTPNPFSTGDATEDIAYSDSIAAFGVTSTATRSSSRKPAVRTGWRSLRTARSRALRPTATTAPTLSPSRRMTATAA